MKALTREILDVLTEYRKVTAAGVAHLLAPKYTILAPSSRECDDSLRMLVHLDYADRLPSEGFGPIYIRKEGT